MPRGAASLPLLFMVIVIGLLVENVFFRNVEMNTINKWGMQR